MIFESHLTQTDPALFFQSPDPLDNRLGSLVSSDLDFYDSCRFAIVSCSQDIGVQRNNGRAGAAAAPKSIRTALYRLTSPFGLKTGDLLDMGDTAEGDDLEEIHGRHEEVIKKLLADGKTVIVLGGGNDLSYPDVRALQSVVSNPVAVNVDAHLDIRKNSRRNSGTPYRQLIEEAVISPDRFFEVGFQPHANANQYLSDASEMGIHLIPFFQLQEGLFAGTMEREFKPFQEDPFFLGFDMDSVKAADAPGVSAPSPTGLTAERALDIIGYLTDHHHLKLFEITEVNPQFDLDQRTARLAAILIYRFLEGMMGKMMTG